MSISFWPAVQNIVGGPSSSPTPIVRDSQWTIVRVDTSTIVGGAYAELPANAEIGDLVEVHYIQGYGVFTTPPAGETIEGNASVPGPHFFRKLDTGFWGSI